MEGKAGEGAGGARRHKRNQQKRKKKNHPNQIKFKKNKDK